MVCVCVCVMRDTAVGAQTGSVPKGQAGDCYAIDYRFRVRHVESRDLNNLSVGWLVDGSGMPDVRPPARPIQIFAYRMY